MSYRFFVAPPIKGDRAILEGPEAHHALHVMRLSVGDRIVVFDGTGCEFPATVTRIRRSQVDLAVDEPQSVDRELACRITLGVALPKGERQKWLFEKAVELGVAELVPLESRYSVVTPPTDVPGRLQRTVIEASKQCGRNRLMEIRSPMTWEQFVSTWASESLRLVAHPGSAVANQKQLMKAGPYSSAVLAVGPEGGFADAEIASADAEGWSKIDLGPRILRIETAAVALVVMVGVWDALARTVA